MARRYIRYLRVQTDRKPDISDPKSDIKWWQEVKYIGVLLFVVGLIILGIGVGLGFLGCDCTNTGESGPVPPPEPTASTEELVNTTTITIQSPLPSASTAAVGNTTTVPPPLTIEEEHQLQGQKLSALPRCQLVNTHIKVMEVLSKDPSDTLLGELILTSDIHVLECQGFCGSSKHCMAMHVEDEDFVVQYRDGNGTIQHAKRKVMQHKVCQCESS